MIYASINTGSNGNCFYIGNENAAVLVDVGVRKTLLLERMHSMGLSPDAVKAVLITHEHTDHITGLRSFLRTFPVPVYTTRGTYEAIQRIIPEHLFRCIEQESQFFIENFEVQSFSKFHDAAEPFSVTLRHAGLTVGVFTDCGRICSSIKTYFSQCDVAFLESNYCTDLLENGRYPAFLKNRIRGGWGHLSNAQAKEIVIRHRSPHLQHLILSHLSGNNNNPSIVEDTFSGFHSNFQVTVASRYGASAVFSINRKKHVSRKKSAAYPTTSQLTLWHSTENI